MLRNRKMLMLLSLLIAVALWMYVMGTVNPEIETTFTGVKVEMQGQDTLKELGLEASLNRPKVITVTVEGKRSQVNKIEKDDIKAYIDVSTCDYGENRTEITVKLPDGAGSVSIKKMSDYQATFTVK